ncbi:protein involved in gliding motility RemB [Mesonia phycicola]|uniref:Protein involved in gliding motility RemB n=1 Tax=Mesonia phycicola TaxID=579105 RepID=A0A1M6EV54_9FLAO|nr:gliding motility protein RemB [Mesonia phycicola]SHI89364.1 protein involved in gliding motility RemB [Mesonia phycicola]
MRILPVILGAFLCLNVFSQNTLQEDERFPVFAACENVEYALQEDCFYTHVKSHVVSNLLLPEVVKQDDYRGKMTVLFEVTPEGDFKIIYIDTSYKELITEVERVFAQLPKVKPASYNGNAIFMQFRMPIYIPLDENVASEIDRKVIVNNTSKLKRDQAKRTYKVEKVNPLAKEFDSVGNSLVDYTNKQFASHVNIPFSHEVYNRFDDEMNVVGTNAHTASKPFLYSDVKPYYDFEQKNKELDYKVNSWFGRKFFNEHLVQLQAEDYWLVADVAADLQIGKDFDADFNSTYNNTRAAVIQGGIGENLNFFASVYESQGRFAQYFNQYAESIKPDGGNPAIIPGRGIAKDFDGDYDYPVAEGYLSYSPSKHFNFQFGHGKNFIGDGYRSLLLSDVASPYPFFKMNTSFWKLKYTNTWMSMRDVRPEVTESGSFRTKYVANHYLSYNVTKRLNIGLFESVIWENDNERGFDLNYLNPVIFYRAIEFSTGSRGGNALIGLTGKYKWSNHFNTYGQLIIDEFSSSDIFGGQQSYKNKIGYQLGLKYFNAFNVDNLYFQVEFNQVRPYTYSHNEITLNYGHNNQSLAHLWGANFREVIAIARYKKDRFYGHLKFIVGKRGFELEEDLDPFYGSDIYGNDENRISDNGNALFQGNAADFLYGEIELGYIVNPATNLKVYANFINRNISADLENVNYNFQNNTSWINFGFRTDLFNWYYDF